jgi:hypothetical protein
MPKKPKPLPLAYTKALIENEKKAVLRRTANRIRQLTEAEDTPEDSNSPATPKTGQCLYYTKLIAIAAFSLTLYTICVMLFSLHCRCTCNL